MKEKTLKLVKQVMEALCIPYAYGLYNQVPGEMWFVGDYHEESRGEEDGCSEGSFLLTGTARTYYSLELARAALCAAFPPVEGRQLMEDGAVVSAWYDGALPVTTGEDDWKRMEIRLDVRCWQWGRDEDQENKENRENKSKDKAEKKAERKDEA